MQTQRGTRSTGKRSATRTSGRHIVDRELHHFEAPVVPGSRSASAHSMRSGQVHDQSGNAARLINSEIAWRPSSENPTGISRRTGQRTSLPHSRIALRQGESTNEAGTSTRSSKPPATGNTTIPTISTPVAPPCGQAVRDQIDPHVLIAHEGVAGTQQKTAEYRYH